MDSVLYPIFILTRPLRSLILCLDRLQKRLSCPLTSRFCRVILSMCNPSLSGLEPTDDMNSNRSSTSLCHTKGEVSPRPRVSLTADSRLVRVTFKKELPSRLIPWRYHRYRVLDQTDEVDRGEKYPNYHQQDFVKSYSPTHVSEIKLVWKRSSERKKRTASYYLLPSNP